MKPIVAALAKVARSDATVLLQGESGTGKEVAARFVHDSSPRAAPVCRAQLALDRNLLESEFSGPERRVSPALTRSARPHELPLEARFPRRGRRSSPGLQAKLLRVLGRACSARSAGRSHRRDGR